MSLKKFFKKIRYGERCDSQTYIKYLKKKGVTIGDRTVIFDPQTTIIDETRPWMIEIGNDVQITSGVTLLTHGYDWSVLKGVYGEVLGSSGVLKIGNNVFIGMHSTILKGVTIGNNVIIGANSLVNKDIPDNCVAAGNPCRVIMSLEEYYKKRKNVQIDEATELVRAYREKKEIDPDEYALHEFFWLFSDNPDDIPPVWKKMNELVGNEKLTKQKMVEHKKIFDNMEQFLKSIV
ncbi:acyltransferase [Streptococcus lutetiensis]|uniref:acyltransferase n=1 Tax=Streptococcus lutetiensis TaxID=150055 RepID=UPI001F05C9CF|nr:acyltransferase [Streptococcus lutetiensis]